MLDLAVRGGTLVTADGIRSGDIGVAGGVITEVGNVGVAREEIDARELHVLPGCVDVHTHLEGRRGGPDGPCSPDDFRSGTVAAACGGVTTIVDYARQYAGWTLEQTRQFWLGRASGAAVIDFGMHLVLADFSDATLQELPSLVAAGMPTFKIFMNRLGDTDMLRTLRAIGAASGVACIHCENAALDADSQAQLIAEGHTSARYWPTARPRASEIEATARAVEYAAHTRCPIYIVHVATREAVDHVRDGKSRGIAVVAETRPCYLLLTEEHYADPSPSYLGYTGYPPLRTPDDVDAVWAGLRDGTIDTIASDHSAWSLEQKLPGEQDFRELLVGLPSLETQLPALYSRAVEERRLSLPRLVDALSAAPARAMGLYPRKGALAVGSDADLVLFDTNRPTTIRYSQLHGRCGYEPLEGRACSGWPIVTISRGEVLVRNGNFVGPTGRGQFLARTAPAAAGYDGSMHQSGSAT